MEIGINMEKIAISTTQNVTIDYAIASVGDRILATIIDVLMFVAYFFLVAYIINEIGGIESNVYLSIILFFPFLFYDLYCELLFNGQTLGKFLMKIKVVRIDGTQPNLGNYLLRWLFRLIEGVMFFLGLIALITILFNGKGQRLGDIAAKTTVIKLGKEVTLKDTVYKPVEEHYEIVFKEVDALSEKDFSELSEIFNYAMKHKKIDIVNQLANKVKQTLNIKTDLKSIAFLETIIKDFTYLNFKD